MSASVPRRRHDGDPAAIARPVVPHVGRTPPRRCARTHPMVPCYHARLSTLMG